MSNNSSIKVGSSGVGFSGLLALLFIGLKLGGVMPVAGWSWIWVLCPLWIGMVFLLLLAVVALLIFLLALLFNR